MRALLMALLMGLLLVGCATPLEHNKALRDGHDTPQWSGRLSVQVLGDAASSMSASFVLQGDASKGELIFYSPLGTTLSVLQWTPQQVHVMAAGKHHYYLSLSEMTEATTGVVLPIDAMFDWLQGREVPVAGWQVDLSALAQGTLTAKRTNPAPEVTLRIKLSP